MSIRVSIYLLLTLAFVCYVYSAPEPPTSNGTVVLPPGTSNHGDSKLICQPAKWSDVAVFFLGNYAAHAATVVIEPGATTIETAVIVISACLLPGSGLFRALRAITTTAILSANDLQTAARARALCTFLKMPEDKPNLQRKWQDNGFKIHRKGNRRCERQIHGSFDMPEDYMMMILPKDAQMSPLPSGDRVKLSSNYNAVKILVALVQAVYASSTLYKTRGDQVSRFGYAAFGLTVVPYLFMSLMNLIGNLLRPDYPALYMVESSDMKAAVAEGSTIAGAVAELDPAYEAKLKGANGARPVPESQIPFFLLGILVLLLGIFVPIAVIGSLTHFRKGHSTHSQRVWVMVWIIIGAFFGAIMSSTLVAQMEDDDPEAHGSDGHLIHLMLALLFCAPAIGGFVVVSQEIMSYGVCEAL